MSQTADNEKNERPIYLFGDYCLDVDRGTLTRGAELVPIRPKAWSVLVYLVRHHGKLVSRADIVDAVWHNAAVSDDSVSQCIVEIRRAIDDKNRNKLRTIPRRGFILDIPVTERSKSDASGNDAPFDTASVTAAAPSVDSIAVLPLINMSAVPDNEFFAAGVHEEILTNLSRIEGLRVVSRTTALRYVNTSLTLKAIGRELRTRYIVEGSVRRIENHVRITVQLVDAIEDSQLWARHYDRELTDVFATQSGIAREITNALHLEIQPQSVGVLDDMPTRSVKAYDSYARAKSIERSEILTDSALRRQRKLLEEAVAEDPDFVEAWAYLKEVLDEFVIRIVAFGGFADSESDRDSLLANVVEARKRALDRAVALDPDNIETVLAQASEDFIADQRISIREERKRFIDRALEMDPDNAEAWRHLAWYFRSVDNTEAASEAILKALELDPLYARNVDAAWFHFRSVGDEAMTAQLVERMSQIAPELTNNKVISTIPSSVKLRNVLELFRETAVDTVIDTYAVTLAEELVNFTSWAGNVALEAQTHKAYLMELRNEINNLANLEPDPLPEISVQDDVYNFMDTNALVMAAQQVSGRPRDAAATACRVLEAREHSPAEPRFHDIATILAAADALGEEEAQTEMWQTLFNDDLDGSGNYSSGYFLALAYVDLDRAVEQLLAQKARYPNWPGTDWAAMHHIRARLLIVHPVMQRFYTEEGKWVGYLAERVPEFSEYRT